MTDRPQFITQERNRGEPEPPTPDGYAPTAGPSGIWHPFGTIDNMVVESRTLELLVRNVVWLVRPPGGGITIQGMGVPALEVNAKIDELRALDLPPFVVIVADRPLGKQVLGLAMSGREDIADVILDLEGVLEVITCA